MKNNSFTLSSISCRAEYENEIYIKKKKNLKQTIINNNDNRKEKEALIMCITK